MESYNAFDLRALVSTFVGTDKVYIVRGLEVVSKNGLTIGVRVADCQILNPLDGNGSMYVGLQDDADVFVDLPADQANVFVEAVFTNTTQAPVNRGVWDPLAQSGDTVDGQEFSAAIDTQEIIVLDIQVNTVGFSEGAVPLLRASTSASAVTNFNDSRPLLYRLGTGGATPDPLNKYEFSGTRDEAVPNGVGVANAVDSPWRSRDAVGAINDKAFRSFKDWADAVMTRISEISGLLWYQSATSGPGSVNVSLQQLWFDTIGHSIQPSKNAAFKWKDNGSGLVLAGEGKITLNGVTSQYHSGLMRWKMNNSSLEWHLGGTFSNNIPGGKRNYLSSGLRFESGVPVDGGNIYLFLERDVPKGSGANVNWGNAGTSAFAATESVSGSPGDFSGIAIGDYIREQSGAFTSYYLVTGMWDGSTTYSISTDADQNRIADNTITALELRATTGDPSATMVPASSEPLLFFRSRYSDDDMVVDDTAVAEGVIHNYQNTNFYWLGRRDGNLFFLRNYGTMQEGEEATALDAVFAQGKGGSGQGGLTLEHAKEAVYDSGVGHTLKTGAGTLITIRRRKRDNTVDSPGSGDNSGSLLEYSITAPVGLMTVGQNLWVRLSDTTSAVLSSGSVTNTTNDEDNTDLTTNLWEIRDAVDSPTSTFDNIDIYLLAKRVAINGQAALLFSDGSILTNFGQMINTNLDISGELRLNDYSDTAIPFIEQTGTKLLDQDVAEFFYNKTTGVFGVRNLRFDNTSIYQDVPEDIDILPNLGSHTAKIGGVNSTVYIPGDLIVDGTTFAASVENLQSDDKLITLGVGNLLNSGYGSGIEVADNTLTTTQADSTIALSTLDLTYGVAHGYTLGDLFGVSASDDVGGITAGQISGQYEIVAVATTYGEAEVVSPLIIRLYTDGTATATESSVALLPRTFTSPWSMRISAADGDDYTGITSFAFRVKNVATAPTITPVLNYGIVPTAHSSNMISTRIPFVNNDNSGPSDDSTLNFSANLVWDNSLNILSVTGNINPGADDTHDLGTSLLQWRIGYFGPGSNSGLRIGTANLYENGSNLLKTDDVFETAEYLVGGRMLQLDETVALTGPAPLPLGTDLNIFQRGGLVYSQDSTGLQRLLTNSEGNIYNEQKTGLTQIATIFAPYSDTIPFDKNFVLTNTAVATTLAAASGDIDITIVGHGLIIGAETAITTSTDIDGILAAAITGTYTGVAVLAAPGEFQVISTSVIRIRTAGSATLGGVSGYIDQARAINPGKLRRYLVGYNEIEVTLNGVKQLIGIDYGEVGGYGNLSSTINWYKDLDPTDVIEYRIDANGGHVIISSGGGGGDLQSAYDAGNSIITTPGIPFTVGGTATKVAVFNGDIDVTGVIDPKGITFDPQATTPLSAAQYGLWTSNNTDKDLIYHRAAGTSINVIQDFVRRDGTSPMTADLNLNGFQVIATTAPTLGTHLTNKDYVDSRDRYTAVYIDGTNNTGSSIPAGSIVILSTTVANEIALADATSILTSDGTVGITVAAIADGASGKVQISGESEVNVVQTGAFDLGKPVYITTTAGSGSSTPPDPAITGRVAFSIGTAKTTTKVVLNPQFRSINSNVYLEDILIVPAVPGAGNDNELAVSVSTGVVARGTSISLPADSRNSNAAKTYTIGSGRLKVKVNGIYLDQGRITENSTSTFQINDMDLDVDDVVSICLDPETTSYLLSAGAGTSTLQQAYNAGAVINITSGNPITINGPAAQKLLVINGDIDVTGVIDPSAITFSTQATDPTPANQHGLYINSSGELIHSKDNATTTNLTQIVENISILNRIESQFLNATGSTLSKAKPVALDANGELVDVNISSIDVALATIGLTSDSFANAIMGYVTTHGRLENVTITAIVGDILYVKPSGGVIGTSELVGGAPSAGNNGFASGDLIIRCGVVAKNIDNPAQKDIMVDIAPLWTLS